jgi:class 3 adenylate cyclase
MICHNCQHENPDDAKFCNNCGVSLAPVCANCGQKNPAGSLFCNNCGHKLGQAGKAATEPEPVPAKASLQSLLTKDYAARLESARASQAMVGERRIVTMLFCDVTGSTAAAERLDPEEWAEIINQVFKIMIGPVCTYDGTVARLMGDAILAFFGAPVAHEDDPQRAILTGLDINRPDQVWAADITYVPMPLGFMYPSAVLRAGSGRYYGLVQPVRSRLETF